MAIACSCAPRAVKPSLEPVRVWTGRTSSGRSRKRGDALPDVLIDGEIVALDHHGAPDFSTLQAAISDGKTDNLIFYAFDLLFADGQDLRRLPLGERKARLKALLEARAKAKSKSIRYVEHSKAAGCVLQSARKLSLEGIVSKKLSAPIVPDVPKAGPRPNAAPDRRVVLGGWKTTNGKFRSLMAGVHRGDPSGLCRDGRHRLWTRHGQADHAGVEGRRI